MISCVVYYSEEPYIDDNDDIVAGVASVQLVLIYFAALAAYTAQEAEQKQFIFSGVAFGVILVMIFSSSFIMAIYIIFLDVFGYSQIQYTSKAAYKQVLRSPSIWVGSTRDAMKKFTRHCSHSKAACVVQQESAESFSDDDNDDDKSDDNILEDEDDDDADDDAAAADDQDNSST